MTAELTVAGMTQCGPASRSGDDLGPLPLLAADPRTRLPVRGRPPQARQRPLTGRLPTPLKKRGAVTHMSQTAPKHQGITRHAALQAWVEEVAALTQPDEVHWCDGSVEEYEQLLQALVEAGTAQRLSIANVPGPTWCAPIPPTPPAWRIAPSSARPASPTPARPTTGVTRRRCARR